VAQYALHELPPGVGELSQALAELHSLKAGKALPWFQLTVLDSVGIHERQGISEMLPANPVYKPPDPLSLESHMAQST
jgi:hypothetical protein